MQSAIVKRSVVIGDHKTSVSLEDAFWKGLGDIARRWHITPSELIEEIKANRKQGTNLSSAIRLFVLEVYQDQIAPPKTLKSPIEDGRRMSNIDRVGEPAIGPSDPSAAAGLDLFPAVVRISSAHNRQCSASRSYTDCAIPSRDVLGAAYCFFAVLGLRLVLLLGNLGYRLIGILTGLRDQYLREPRVSPAVGIGRHDVQTSGTPPFGLWRRHSHP
jgi:predicted DNA-binding ribbon-helix-helix protein